MQLKLCSSVPQVRAVAGSGMTARCSGASNCSASASSRSSAGVGAIASSSRHQIGRLRPSARQRSNSATARRQLPCHPRASNRSTRMRLVRAAPSNFKPFTLKRPRRTAAAVAAARFSGVSSSSAIRPIAVALLQGGGAQRLLDLASLGERHEDARHAGLQPVDRCVVAALADSGGAAREHRAIVRAQRFGEAPERRLPCRSAWRRPSRHRRRRQAAASGGRRYAQRRSTSRTACARPGPPPAVTMISPAPSRSAGFSAGIGGAMKPV